jgi:hypothetical protein
MKNPLDDFVKSGRQTLELGLALTPVGHDAFEEIPDS